VSYVVRISSGYDRLASFYVADDGRITAQFEDAKEYPTVEAAERTTFWVARVWVGYDVRVVDLAEELLTREAARQVGVEDPLW
jgi:hypothetical protein